MTIEKIGYGAGRDLEEQANVLRLLVGTTADATAAARPTNRCGCLETNLDDISGELVGHTVGTALASRRTRHVHYGNPDEEEPPRDYVKRALSGGTSSGDRSNPVSRDHDAGSPAVPASRRQSYGASRIA